MKFVILLSVFLVLFSPSVKAEDSIKTSEDFYREQYEISGADQIEENIPPKTKEYLEENGLNPENFNWVDNLSAENVFTHIWNFLKGGAKQPIKAGFFIMAVILITSALSSVEISGNVKEASVYASVLCCAAIIAPSVYSAINSAVAALKGTAVFMSAFIPIFAVIVASAGKTATSVSMSSLLLAATQGVSYISNFVVVPLTGGYLAVSISSSVSPWLKTSGLSESIKKLTFWIMSLVSTVFVGILGIQTAVNSSADGLMLKTAKFIVGTSVPVAGGVLSEALGTVTASMGLLKSSVGIYGTVVLVAILLPIVIELLIWRVILTVSYILSELFSLGQITVLLKAVDSVMSILIGIILLTGAMFVISLSVVVSAGKAV